MRLLVVTQDFWPETFNINDLVAEFVRRGHQVTVLTGLPNYPAGKVFPEYLADPKAFATYEGVEVVRAPMMPRGSRMLTLVLNYFTYVLSTSVVGPYKLRGRQFDAILVYAPSPPTVGLTAVVMSRLKRIPMAFWILDLWPETLEAVGAVRSPTILSMVGSMMRFIYRNSALILAQSRSFIPQIRKYAGEDANIVYFPSWSDPGVDMQLVEPAPEITSVPGSFNIMFAGNMGTAQDFPAILEAVKKLKVRRHIRWHFVGDGRMLQWVQDEIRKHGLQECVSLWGRHPPERMPSFFRHADALLVCLTDEPIFSMTIPGKVQAYLAAGIPVLAMLNGEGAEVVAQAGAGLVCPAGDSDALVERVLQLSEMPAAQRAKMGERGRESVARDFDRNRLISSLENWLQDMARQAGK